LLQLGHLAEAVAARTSGNPYDSVELVNALRRDGVLAPGEAGWTWDDAALRAFVGEGDVVDLLAARIDHLPTESQALLEVMACLAGEVEVELLRVAAAEPAAADLLLPALEDGLLVHERQAGEDTVRFRHDRVQQAAYGRLDPDRRRDLHLASARHLAQHPALAMIAAEQYLAAVDSVTDTAERHRVVGLFRAAAARVRLINYAAAEQFLATAARILAADDPLLAEVRAEWHAALYALGRLAEADDVYRAVEQRDPDPLVLAPSACVQISSLTGREQTRDALTLGADLLHRLGLRVPPAEDLPAAVEHGLDALLDWGAELDPDVDRGRAEITDPRMVAATTVINRMVPVAFFGDQVMMGWLVTEARRLWDEHGPHPALIPQPAGRERLGRSLDRVKHRRRVWARVVHHRHARIRERMGADLAFFVVWQVRRCEAAILAPCSLRPRSPGRWCDRKSRSCYREALDARVSTVQTPGGRLTAPVRVAAAGGVRHACSAGWMSVAGSLSETDMIANPPHTFSQTTRRVPSGEHRRGNRNAGTVLMLAICLPVLATVLITPVLPAIQARFAAVPQVTTLVPLLLAVPSIATAVASPIVGVILDYAGRRHLLIGSLVLFALAGTAPVWLNSLQAIIASRVVLGVAVAAVVTCSTTLIGDYYTGATRARLLVLQTVFAASSAIAFFLVGGVLGSAGWRGPFWAHAVSLILLPFMVLALPRPRDGRSNSTQSDPLTRWRSLLPKCLLTLVGSVIFHVPVVETTYVLGEVAVNSAEVIGIVTALTSVATVIGAAAIYQLYHADPRGLLTAGFSFAAVGFAIVAGSANLTTAMAGMVVVLGLMLSSIGCGLLLPTLLIWSVSQLDYKRRGRGTGVWNGAFYLGQFICPLAMLALSERIGGLLATFGVTAAACAVLALATGLAAALHKRTSALVR
jgi:MFS family permease